MESWKILLIALAGAAIIGASTWATIAYTHHNKLQATATTVSPTVVEAFKAWQLKYNVKLADDGYRLTVFNDNYNKIQAHNEKPSTYKLGENQYMATTLAEFKVALLGLKPKSSPSKFGVHLHDGAKAADSIDWRQKGKVGPVKDQGQCGSCWAFSTTGSLECDAAIEAGATVSLSEQQLVDCSSSYGNQGCDGGLMDQAFQYVIDNGITSESNYKYKAVTGTCQTAKTQDKAYQISSFKDVISGNCDDLINALQTQPVSIGVDAEEWQFYSGGVFSNCGDQLDHGVLVVGYDTSKNWFVRNSWGTSWGEAGYITLAAGNTCGICNTASYPRK